MRTGLMGLNRTAAQKTRMGNWAPFFISGSLELGGDLSARRTVAIFGSAAGVYVLGIMQGMS